MMDFSIVVVPKGAVRVLKSEGDTWYEFLEMPDGEEICISVVPPGFCSNVVYIPEEGPVP